MTPFDETSLRRYGPGCRAGARRAFAGVDDVACEDGDILAVARNALVSPANSYGFMDGPELESALGCKLRVIYQMI